MKNLYLLPIFILVLLFAACKKEERVCLKSDFIGDFLGSSNCMGNGAGSLASIKIREGNAANELIVDVDGFIMNVMVDGCKFSGSDISNDVNITFTGELNGEIIKTKLKGTVFGTEVDCDAEGEKNN